MEKRKLNLIALSHSVTQSNNYAVVLGEESGNRKLPIIIGGFEAQAIAVALEKLTPNRPLTHDLFMTTLGCFEIKLKEIIISNLVEGIFYSTLVLEQGGNVMQVDSRTSDAIAMAVRFRCPIYAYEFILESAGLEMEEGAVPSEGEEAPASEPKKAKTLSDYSVTQLETMLGDVLADEDYEKAALIRDELNRRSENQ